MRKITLLLTLLILSACTSPTLQKGQVSLDDKEWKPVNTNYMNRKDF